MGRQLTCIVVNGRERDYFASMPEHRNDLGLEILNRLKWRGLKQQSFSPVGAAYHKVREDCETVAVGAYEGGAIVLGERVSELLDPRVIKELCALLDLYPRAKAALLQIYDTVSRYAYMYFEDGRFVRACGADANEGLFLRAGAIQPEEARVLGYSEGEPISDDQFARDLLHAGEDLPFAVAEKVVNEEFFAFKTDLGVALFRHPRAPGFTTDDLARKLVSLIIPFVGDRYTGKEFQREE